MTTCTAGDEERQYDERGTVRVDKGMGRGRLIFEHAGRRRDQSKRQQEEL
jgi:hypothetical protein